MKNVVKLQNYYFPGQLEHEVGNFVEFYNNDRYHEYLNNVTPADVYFGLRKEILSDRAIIKQQTMQVRRKQNLQTTMLA